LPCAAGCGCECPYAAPLCQIRAKVGRGIVLDHLLVVLGTSGFFDAALGFVLLPGDALGGNPDSPQVALRGQEEDIGDAIAAKIRNVLLAYYRPYAGHPGINIKLHSTTLYNSIYWFDDDMLVNTHAYGVPAHFAPVLHLRHLSSGSLFQTYARSFDRVWDQTRKVWNGCEVINGG